MDEKDIQYLALVIMQFHAQIGKMQRDNQDLQKQLDELRQLHDTKEDPGQEN